MNARSARLSSIAELLWEAADESGDRPAIDTTGQVVTYADLRRRASSVAASLVAHGVQRGDRVAILAERGPEAVAAYFGALAAGAVAVVINERLRPRQIEYVLEKSSARVMLSTPALRAEHPRPLETQAVLIDLAAVPDVTADWTPLPIEDRALAQIIFTSGSSGLPKGVVFSHRAILTAIETIVGYLGLGSDERIFSLLPFSSVYGLNQLLCSVWTKSTLVVSHSATSESMNCDSTVKPRRVCQTRPR